MERVAEKLSSESRYGLIYLNILCVKMNVIPAHTYTHVMSKRHRATRRAGMRLDEFALDALVLYST